MEDTEDLVNILNYYRQRASELELANLKLQLQISKLMNQNAESIDKPENNKKSK